MSYPKPWLAALLGFLSQPIGLLYVARPGWAAVYFLVPLLLVSSLFFSGLSLLQGVLSWSLAIVCAVHAYRLAKKIPADEPRPAYSRWYGLMGIAASLVGLIFLFRAFLFEPFHIPAGSMRPNFKVGQDVVVSKWGYGHYGSFGITPFRTAPSEPLRRGDVVVFDYPPDPSLQYIKRIVGLPGDAVAMAGNGLSINGKEVQRERQIDALPGLEQHLESLGNNAYAVLLDAKFSPPVRAITRFPFIENCQYSTESLRCSVPAGHYFVLGDNRDNSQDSRYWGFVPAANIVGKVVYVTP